MLKVCYTTHMAAFAFVTFDKKALFFLRDNNPSIPFPGHWSLLGGADEPGETFEQTMIRELKEEGDIEVSRYHYLFDSQDPNQPSHAIFSVVLSEDQVKKISKGTEGQEIRWMTLDEIDKLPKVPALANILKTKYQILQSLLS